MWSSGSPTQVTWCSFPVLWHLPKTASLLTRPPSTTVLSEFAHAQRNLWSLNLWARRVKSTQGGHEAGPRNLDNLSEELSWIVLKFLLSTADPFCHGFLPGTCNPFLHYLLASLISSHHHGQKHSQRAIVSWPRRGFQKPSKQDSRL